MKLKYVAAKNKLVAQKLSVGQGDEMKQVLSEAKQEIIFKNKSNSFLLQIFFWNFVNLNNFLFVMAMAMLMEPEQGEVLKKKLQFANKCGRHICHLN